jgi:hypothetical protein
LRERAVELGAGSDAQLAENLPQVVLDDLGADEQSRADLRVGEAFAGQAGDLGLLGGEVLARLDGALSGALASRQELALRPLGEGLHTHPDEHLVGGA